MDGREGMALQGSTHYFMHRPISGASDAQEQGHFGHFTVPSPSYRPANPNFPVIRAAYNVEGGPGAGPMGQPNNGPPQGFTITLDSVGGSIKKKRGRPRKYGPHGPGGPCLGPGSGAMSLALSPPSSNSGSAIGERKKRGRPPGSGRKQRLASVGGWMSNSAGDAFVTHVIHVQPGEDIAGKILSFAQQRQRAMCIMSGSGSVSAVTLRHPSSSAGSVAFEGCFEILCLSGSYLVAESGGSHNRVGGVNVSLSSPNGHVIGGAVAGRLVASRPVQVVVCSFICESMKGKSKESEEIEEMSSKQLVSDKTLVQLNASPTRYVDSKNPNIDIDLGDG